MAELSALFLERRDQIARELGDCPDAKAACDIVERQLSRMRRERLSQLKDAGQKERLNQLFAAAISGMGAMVSVSQVNITMQLTPRSARAAGRGRRTVRELLRLLPAALCAVLAVWLFLDGKTPASLLALISGAASYVTLGLLRAPAHSVPDVVGEARVDVTELLRRVEHTIGRMDELMQAPAIEREQPLLLTDGLMASIQMLMEARLDGDGAFALKALPQMMDSLGRQGIEMVPYSFDVRQHFDLLPAAEGGQTIRPALMKDGKPLMRGQATIEG